jgi:hypothetical protein
MSIALPEAIGDAGLASLMGLVSMWGWLGVDGDDRGDAVGSEDMEKVSVKSTSKSK